jgi:hypothetical protein
VQARVGAQLGIGGKIAQFRFVGKLVTVGVISAADLLAFANALAAVVDAGKALWTADVRSLSVACQGFVLTPHAPSANNPALFSITPDTINIGNSAPAIGNGTHPGSSLPPQNAVAVTLRSNTAGRRARGRVFGFPPAEGEVDSTGIITGHDFKSLVDNLISAINGATLNGQPVDAVVLSLMDGLGRKIVSTDQGGRIDTQRRRLVRTPR